MDAIIFDGDDTLWETTPLYAGAKQDFFGRMSLLGFDPREVEREFHLIDVANVDRLGFSKERFPTSMAETYRFFCEKHDASYDRMIENAMRDIGYRVFEQVPALCEGAEWVLSQLRGHYRLFLATKGDQDIQRAKIQHSKLSDFFERIYILDRKTVQDMNRIVQECQLAIQKTWVVGDSLKSDINPALAVGFNAIWIPKKGTWAYEDDSLPTSDRFYQLETLSDLLTLLLPGRP
jgi:putative hydrolase of the HAD superfamily